jgi:hypothetical protein
MPPAAKATHFAVSIDKRLTLGAIAAVGIALFSIGWNASTANGRIERLEDQIKPVVQINERTIRIEEQVNAIRAQLERRH